MNWIVYIISALLVCVTIWFVGAKICRTICAYLARIINELKIKKYD